MCRIKRQKRYTNAEAYEKLKSMNLDNGCEIILDWDNARRTMLEWVDYIIETYFDLNYDLLELNEILQTIDNVQNIILPLLKYKLSIIQ